MSDSNSDSISISKHAVRRAATAIAAVVAGALLVAGGMWIAGRVEESDPLASAINSRDFQAVVLTNGQIYFGKLSVPGGNFYYLRHAFYLTTAAARTGGTQQRVLAPIVKDVHAPEDLMVINRSHIVYVENLSPSGAVSRRMQQTVP